eukprot:PITA_27802
MALMSKFVVTEPSSFEEAVEDPAWVDATVEEYDSIVRNSAWEIVPRPEGKSVVGIDNYLTGLAFSKSEADRNLYQIVVEGKFLIIVLYVDDLILRGDELLILSCKDDLAKEFEMKDLGLLHYFLGLEIWQRNGGLFVSQGKYAQEILEKFNMHGCKPVDSPLPGGWRKEDATSGEEVDASVSRQLVGSLMYLVNTRPNICYAVNQLSQAMVKPTKLFWNAGKHVLCYLRGTSGYGLWYKEKDEVKLCGFTDADWVGSPTDRKSTSGGVFSIGSTTLSWYNRKQRSVALSLGEAEYMAASLAAYEAIWMRKILIGLFSSHLVPTVIYYDN